MKSQGKNGGALPDSPEESSSMYNFKDTYQDAMGPQSYDITEEVESIARTLKNDAQCFHGTVYTQFIPVAFRFNDRKNKFKIKVKTDNDYIHLIGSKISKGQYELTYATEGNNSADEL